MGRPRSTRVCAEPGCDNKHNLDHCHADGQFRGVLCAQCNRGLGSFRDSPALLEAEIKYLARTALAKAS